MKQLSIIIVNYNVCHFLEQALISVSKAISRLDVEVFVVDNNSADGSVEMVKTKFPFVNLIVNEQNVGFSKANNQAIAQATGEYILLLNPDTVIEIDTLEKCIHFMNDHPQGGGLGVKMIDGKGDFLAESKRGFPTPWVAFYKIFGLAKLFPKSRKFGHYHLGYLDKNESHEVEVLSGAFMVLRKSVIDKIGALDEDYFMYGEDIDLSYRIIRAGYKNYYFSDTRIIHYKGESTKKTSINYVFIFYKAMIIFAQKHFTSKNTSVFTALIYLAIYFRAFIAVSNRILEKVLPVLFDSTLIFASLASLFYFKDNGPVAGEAIYSVVYKQIIPLFTVVWTLSLFFNGAYKSTATAGRLLRSFVFGTFIIASISYFIDEYRYSKTFLLEGSLLSMSIVFLFRSIIHWIKNGSFDLGENKNKKIVIVGSYRECERIDQLLLETNYNLNVLGFITTGNKEDVKGKYLGFTKQLQNIVSMYKVDEIIFCSKDLPANSIIEWMTQIDNTKVDFKIVPEESNIIIGSNSKNRRGDFYTLNINLNIIEEKNIQNKRILDVCVSLIFIFTYPVILWLIEKPRQFFLNTIQVLTGKKSWVGFTNTQQINLPQIKRGIINPTYYLEKSNRIPTSNIQEINLSYARDYNPYMDLVLIAKSFKYLGS
ncbi:MAG: glycosyltransferase [Cytophaga sp.]|uniref:glycosyltransferase n=1 Tax=Cytophaga sp. TaxID=29535 RepID=UPI003F7DAC6B